MTRVTINEVEFDAKVIYDVEFSADQVRRDVELIAGHLFHEAWEREYKGEPPITEAEVQQRLKAVQGVEHVELYQLRPKPKKASLSELQADGWRHFIDYHRTETFPSSDIIIVEKQGRYMRSEYFAVRADDNDCPGSKAEQCWWPVKMVPKTINTMVDLKSWDETVDG